jgi:signal transduction histidine kinase
MRPELSDKVLAYLGNPQPPPPLSMMIAPLVSDGELLGFLRCWVAESGPTYYSSDDLALLGLVAENLSQTLGSWRQEERAQERLKENHQAVAKGLTGERIGGTKEERDIYLAALGLVHQLIPEALFNTIRLKSPETNRLNYYGYAIYPPYGTITEERSKELGRSSITLPARSFAGQVMEKQKLRLIRGQQLGDHPTDHAQAAGEMIIAPLLLGDGQAEGVLEMRTSPGQRFPAHAQAVAGSVSALLALQMAKEKAEQERLVSEQQKFETKLKADRAVAASDKALREAFEDVAHQLKSPLLEAARRVEEAEQRYTQGAIAKDLAAMAGMLRRAELTAKLIGLFAKLAKKEPLTQVGQPLTPVELVKLVGEVCENQRPRIPERRNIKLEYDVDSFYQRAPSELQADRELLLQALNNLVDNAVKYAYSHSAIRVFAHRFGEGKFALVVTNKGIPIEPHEVNLVHQRNWRGEQAKTCTGEGNGLGLWIVDNIMRAHGGALQVLPTRRSDGITEVRLVFLFAANLPT